MSVKIDITFKGMEHVDEFVNKVAPEVVAMASRQAVNKTIRKVHTEAVRSVSNASGVKPLKIIKKRFKRFLANRRRDIAGVYFHYEPLPLEALGDINWSRFMPGVRVGRKSYPGTFAATPRRGKHAGKRARVYERVANTGSNQSDLHAQYVILNKFAGILPNIGWIIVKRDLDNIFKTQMDFRLRKAGYIK